MDLQAVFAVQRDHVTSVTLDPIGGESREEREGCEGLCRMADERLMRIDFHCRAGSKGVKSTA
jgi:hypothetical protein